MSWHPGACPLDLDQSPRRNRLIELTVGHRVDYPMERFSWLNALIFAGTLVLGIVLIGLVTAYIAKM
jgi:hypothetical protein